MLCLKNISKLLAPPQSTSRGVRSFLTFSERTICISPPALETDTSYYYSESDA